MLFYRDIEPSACYLKKNAMFIQLQENTIDLSVVIPTLNEADNLKVLLPAIKESLESLGMTWEILVVDGDSDDGADSVCDSVGARYICEARKGYGTAILRGVSEARGAYILTMDADLSHPAHIVKDLWEARSQADITIASRYVKGGKANQPWLRLQLSRTLNAFFGIGLSIDIRDMSSGFRLYRKEILGKLDLEFTNFVVVIEIVLSAYADGCSVREIPFHYHPRGAGESKARVYQFGKDYLRLFNRIRKKRKSH
jgi:dolichol-phosphate mannosyltransferase